MNIENELVRKGMQEAIDNSGYAKAFIARNLGVSKSSFADWQAGRVDYRESRLSQLRRFKENYKEPINIFK